MAGVVLPCGARSYQQDCIHGAVLLIDLDNFKYLNDTAGHDVGDSLLRHIARRLVGVVREGDTVARLGGDEFVIILEAVVDGDLERSCQLLADWATQPDKEHLTLSVNVSVRQFMEPDFVASILAALDATGAPPNRLKLELTESLLAKDLATVVAKMNDVKRWGVRLSMDDFGTGYSSLSYLRQLPLNQLKIDQSFVRHVVTNDHDAAIADMILSLASHLDLSVVAEGVETHEQHKRLEELGCRQFQGYLFGRPVPAEEWN